MNQNKTRTAAALDTSANDQLVEGMLEKAVQFAQRNAEQFAKLAALARAIEQCNSSPATRAKLLFSFEEAACNAEMDAKIDIEFFEGLRNGHIMKEELRRERQQPADAVPETTIFAPSTNTKH